MRDHAVGSVGEIADIAVLDVDVFAIADIGHADGNVGCLGRRILASSRRGEPGAKQKEGRRTRDETKGKNASIPRDVLALGMRCESWLRSMTQRSR